MSPLSDDPLGRCMGSLKALARVSMDEPKLIRLFTDLTGEPEGTARSVVMYLDMLEEDYFPTASQERGQGSEEGRTGARSPAPPTEIEPEGA
jgi:hypothetical protein